MLYHVTPSENVKNILRTGLLPHTGRASRQNNEDRARVYLFTSLDWVKEGMETWLGEIYRDKDLSVLSIDATAEELGGEINGGEVLVEKPVPPSVIKELYSSEKIDEALDLEY